MHHTPYIGYLKEIPKKQYECLTVPTRVINAGLTNRPDLKKRLEDIVSQLNEVLNNNDAHLTDIACQLGFSLGGLQTLIVDTFEAHQIEQDFDF